MSINIAIEKSNATQIVKQIGLNGFLEHITNSPRGDTLAVGHTHHTDLSEQFWGCASQWDFQQVEDYFLDPNFTEFVWLVVTNNHKDWLTYSAFWSHRDKQRNIIHDLIPILEPFGDTKDNITFRVFV